MVRQERVNFLFKKYSSGGSGVLFLEMDKSYFLTSLYPVTWPFLPPPDTSVKYTNTRTMHYLHHVRIYILIEGSDLYLSDFLQTTFQMWNEFYWHLLVTRGG